MPVTKALVKSRKLFDLSKSTVPDFFVPKKVIKGVKGFDSQLHSRQLKMHPLPWAVSLNDYFLGFGISKSLSLSQGCSIWIIIVGFGSLFTQPL